MLSRAMSLFSHNAFRKGEEYHETVLEPLQTDRVSSSPVFFGSGSVQLALPGNISFRTTADNLHLPLRPLGAWRCSAFLHQSVLQKNRFGRELNQG